MAGVLQFTLGLETSNFLRSVGLASGSILSLASVGQSLQTAMRGVTDAIESGAKYKDLSARTGESVENLFKLRHALDIVGVGADAAAPMVLKLQKSMSGVTEDGEKTSDLFKAIGLDFEKLKGMDVAERMVAIGTALDGINKDQAAGIAGKIFGREGAGNILQIARSMADFKQSLVEAGPAAQVLQRASDSFDKIDDTVTTIKMKANGMFAGIAEGLGPALQTLLDFLNNIDFVGFGERIGNELQIAINAIKLDKFGEYFTLSLQAGIQDASNLMMKEIIKWSDAASKPKGEGEVSGFWNRTGHTALGVAAGGLGLWNQIGANMGVPGAEEMADKRIQQAYDLFAKTGMNDGILMNISDAFTRGIEGQKNEFRDRLNQMRETVLKTVPGWQEMFNMPWDTKPKRTADLPDNSKPDKGSAFSPPQVSNIEKLGFVFNNGIGRGDHQQNIADNTRRTYEAVNKLIERLGNHSAPSFANQ